ncbi:hypothetical protein [Sinorhizobium terangae]|uniref:Uncharacterized protein n=1 Tax=Sinorhizobium terangae TaxID=110322 RepID=A0A6N7L992_SINTE|nr:hypothetical protein [Sinorhizobium terangae]MBB4185559.1 hypothetical protein [Sinorhizobium terangae]MQX13314.1 hypothetical protein [Sinorhizobium terangae]WFU46374.1 hypothetical protein QA637_10690 [Sinorhizobium terangae]
MTSSKHPKTRHPNDKDLKQDPGIGRSKGIRGPSDYEMLKRGNTIEGDVANDTTTQGGANPRQRGRTNK